MQNLKSFGGLDKQRAAEQEVQLRAKRLPAYTIVRVASGLLEDSDDAEGRAELRPGDALDGAVPASAAGRVLVESLARPEAINASFSLGAVTSTPVPAAAFWEDEFLRLVGPDILRKPLPSGGVDAAESWLRKWAKGFLVEGQTLTTPVQVEDVTGGAMLRFLGSAARDRRQPAEDAEADKWEAADAKWQEAAAAQQPARPVAEGALLIVAEESPTGTRVRVARAEMEGHIVKELSETAVLERLRRDFAALEQASTQ